MISHSKVQESLMPYHRFVPASAVTYLKAVATLTIEKAQSAFGALGVGVKKKGVAVSAALVSAVIITTVIVFLACRGLLRFNGSVKWEEVFRGINEYMKAYGGDRSSMSDDRYPLRREMRLGGCTVVPLRLYPRASLFLLKRSNGETENLVVKRVVAKGDLRRGGLREGSISMRVNHRNVVRTYKVVDELYGPDSHGKATRVLWIVMEHLPLKVSVSAVRGDEGSIRSVVRDLLEAIKYMHGIGVAHLDVKMANVVGTRSERGEVVYKLIDFGYSRYIKDEVGGPENGETYIPGHSYGTFPYKPPEVSIESIHGYKADIYCVGAVAWFLSLGYVPFYKASAGRRSKDVARYKMFIRGNLRHFFKSTTSNELRNFILKCMNRDRKKRPTAEELLKTDEFLNGVKIRRRAAANSIQYSILSDSGEHPSETSGASSTAADSSVCMTCMGRKSEARRP